MKFDTSKLKPAGHRFSLAKSIATLGPIGYLPAPGTCATIIAVVLVYLLHILTISYMTYAACVALLCIVAWYAVVHSLDHFRGHDPSEIVIDEVIGCAVTFFMIPLDAWYVIIGFALFRFFDIVKPCGLKKVERMGGAWGILCDDIGAGLLSNVILHMIVYSGLL